MYVKKESYKFKAKILAYQIRNNTSILILSEPKNLNEEKPLRDHLHLKVPKDIFKNLKNAKAEEIEFIGTIDSYEHLSLKKGFLCKKMRISNPRKIKIVESKPFVLNKKENQNA